MKVFHFALLLSLASTTLASASVNMPVTVRLLCQEMTNDLAENEHYRAMNVSYEEHKVCTEERKKESRHEFFSHCENFERSCLGCTLDLGSLAIYKQNLDKMHAGMLSYIKPDPISPKSIKEALSNEQSILLMCTEVIKAGNTGTGYMDNLQIIFIRFRMRYLTDLYKYLVRVYALTDRQEKIEELIPEVLKLRHLCLYSQITCLRCRNGFQTEKFNLKARTMVDTTGPFTSDKWPLVVFENMAGLDMKTVIEAVHKKSMIETGNDAVDACLWMIIKKGYTTFDMCDYPEAFYLDRACDNVHVLDSALLETPKRLVDCGDVKNPEMTFYYLDRITELDRNLKMLIDNTYLAASVAGTTLYEEIKEKATKTELAMLKIIEEINMRKFNSIPLRWKLQLYVSTLHFRFKVLKQIISNKLIVYFDQSGSDLTVEEENEKEEEHQVNPYKQDDWDCPVTILKAFMLAYDQLALDGERGADECFKVIRDYFVFSKRFLLDIDSGLG